MKSSIVGGACNTKSSFQDGTLEDIDENLSISNHCCVNEYSIMPKTIFNEIVIGINNVKQDL